MSFAVEGNFTVLILFALIIYKFWMGKKLFIAIPACISKLWGLDGLLFRKHSSHFCIQREKTIFKGLSANFKDICLENNVETFCFLSKKIIDLKDK